MASVEPTKKQFKQIMAIENDVPLEFTNLLKYKTDGGVASYQTYEEKFMELMDQTGVKVIYRCKNLTIGVGPDDPEYWDEMIVVQYPSKSVWVDMIQSAGYQKIMHYRTEGVADSRLYIAKAGELA